MICECIFAVHTVKIILLKLHFKTETMSRKRKMSKCNMLGMLEHKISQNKLNCTQEMFTISCVNKVFKFYDFQQFFFSNFYIDSLRHNGFGWRWFPAQLFSKWCRVKCTYCFLCNQVSIEKLCYEPLHYYLLHCKMLQKTASFEEFCKINGFSLGFCIFYHREKPYRFWVYKLQISCSFCSCHT